MWLLIFENFVLFLQFNKRYAMLKSRVTDDPIKVNKGKDR